METGVCKEPYLNLDSTPLSESRPISLSDSNDSIEDVLLLKLPTENKQYNAITYTHLWKKLCLTGQLLSNVTFLIQKYKTK